MKKLNQLRQDHQTFTYQSYSYQVVNNDLIIKFSFILHPDIIFHPKIIIPQAGNKSKKIDKKTFNNFVFHLGLIESLSYWKVTCSPLINIKAGSLSQEQINWWQNFLVKGMGEFFYTNKIDFTSKDFVRIKSNSNQHPVTIHKSTSEKYLNLIGGGKDSVVSLEILNNLNFDQSLLMLNPTQASSSVVKKSKINQTISVNRLIDPKLLELNQKEYLNGHTPFSAYLAFLGVLVATIFDYRHIVVANERSSDEENLKYLNNKINHQYSKSFHFEKLFRLYLNKYLSSSLNYFSLVRPLWEIQISKIFSKHSQYFNLFRSCNQKQDKWCSQCPKCLSTFILLYPFLGKKTTEIFSKDLYQDLSLSSLLDQLTDKNKIKPFECVGTREEIIIGLFLSLNMSGQHFPLLEYARKNILINQQGLKNRARKLLSSWGNDQFLPKNINLSLKQLLNE